MPRHSRLAMAETPQLILQRGAGSRPIFQSEEDYGYYFGELRAGSMQYACSVHAYALMQNEVCLLITGDAQGAVSRMMQSLGRRYTHYANARDRTDGSLWSGRYHSCPVGGDRYVLRAMCFVDRSPVRVEAVVDAAAYKWSSHARHAAGVVDFELESHPAYAALGKQDCTRGTRYCELLAAASDDETEIWMHVRQGRAWGDARFLRKVARLFGQHGSARPRGRPRKTGSKALSLFVATLSPFLLTSWICFLQTLAASK